MEKYNDTVKRIQPLAERYMETQKLNYPINNTMQILTEKGYYIIKSAAPLNLSGFYMKKDNYPFIFVNTNHTLGRQNFSLWHEVYHHIMNHKNGISDFNADSLEEREAEIFAGIILLPRKEIDKWISHALTSPETIVKMSDYYQMSFQGVLVRLMQEQHMDYKTYKSLKKYSSLENVTALKHLYEQCHLDTSIMYPTYKTQISENIMTILQKNYAANKTSGEKINEIIEMIERLSDEA
ncbi:ImmA/IrrE family metallo-endopeptidase [Macrococcoides canis]|nr:ImmA/IrrE family metallo-endopeptidase [Macrococcus canis]